jgi:hypothetical protein
MEGSNTHALRRSAPTTGFWLQPLSAPNIAEPGETEGGQDGFSSTSGPGSLECRIPPGPPRRLVDRRLGGRDGGRVVIWLVWWTTLSFAFVSGWALGRRRGPWAHLPP